MRRGFTLVELLAVIVILAIILAIAVPGISNIITNSKLNSFSISSNMLKEATKTYISVTNITVAEGTTAEILYSDIKNAGYISKIVDPISNNECIHSKIYVTNTSGSYTYKGALVCDNYMDINAYNLVTNGDFNNGTAGWSFDGATLSATSNILSVTGNGTSQWPQIYVNTTAYWTQNHKIYLRSHYRVTNSIANGAAMSLQSTGSGTSLYLAGVTSPVINQWYTRSEIGTLGIGDGFLRVMIYHQYTDAASSNGNIMQIDGTFGIYALDLTAIYGAGNEPTIAQINNIMSNMGK